MRVYATTIGSREFLTVERTEEVHVTIPLDRIRAINRLQSYGDAEVVIYMDGDEEPYTFDGPVGDEVTAFLRGNARCTGDDLPDTM